MNHSLPPVALLAAVCCCANAGASQTTELEPRMQVTASRVLQEADDALVPVSVITVDDIRRSQAEDLSELLRLQAGVDVVRTGGPGAQTSVFLRGTNSNHVLVLIDGVRAASTNTGALTWEQLPLAQIERVEIVRGPRASLYGSDAIGGVIQVFTRSDTGAYARATGGSHGTAEIEAGAGLEGEEYRLSLHAARREVDGFSAQTPDGFAYDPDDDGLSSTSAGMRGSWTGGPGEWSASVLATDTESEFDQGTSDGRSAFGGIAWEGSTFGAWESLVRAGYAQEKLASDFGFFQTEFESTRTDFGWRNDLSLGGGGRVSLGVDHYRDRGRSSDGIDESRHNTGLYGRLEQPLGRWLTEVAARVDDNSEFGAEWTGQLATALDLDTAGRFLASVGTGFRAPNLNEQFSPGFGGLFAGNPDLEPETSRSIELGWRRALGRRASLSIAGFHTDVDDLIAFTGEDFAAVNVNRARIRGVEAEWRWARTGWAASGTVTLQDTEDRSTGQALLRRPDAKGSVTLDRLFTSGGWLGLEWFVSGDRLDVGAEPLSGYGIVSLRGGWPVSPSVEVQFRAENIGDRNYVPAAGFASGGRSLYVSLDWRP